MCVCVTLHILNCVLIVFLLFFCLFFLPFVCVLVLHEEDSLHLFFFFKYIHIYIKVCVLCQPPSFLFLKIEGIISPILFSFSKMRIEVNRVWRFQLMLLRYALRHFVNTHKSVFPFFFFCLFVSLFYYYDY